MTNTELELSRQLRVAARRILATDIGDSYQNDFSDLEDSEKKEVFKTYPIKDSTLVLEALNSSPDKWDDSLRAKVQSVMDWVNEHRNIELNQDGAKSFFKADYSDKINSDLMSVDNLLQQEPSASRSEALKAAFGSLDYEIKKKFNYEGLDTEQVGKEKKQDTAVRTVADKTKAHAPGEKSVQDDPQGIERQAYPPTPGRLRYDLLKEHGGKSKATPLSAEEKEKKEEGLKALTADLDEKRAQEISLTKEVSKALDASNRETDPDKKLANKAKHSELLKKLTSLQGDVRAQAARVSRAERDMFFTNEEHKKHEKWSDVQKDIVKEFGQWVKDTGAPVAISDTSDLNGTYQAAMEALGEDPVSNPDVESIALAYEKLEKSFGKGKESAGQKQMPSKSFPLNDVVEGLNRAIRDYRANIMEDGAEAVLPFLRVLYNTSKALSKWAALNGVKDIDEGNGAEALDHFISKEFPKGGSFDGEHGQDLVLQYIDPKSASHLMSRFHKVLNHLAPSSKIGDPDRMADDNDSVTFLALLKEVGHAAKGMSPASAPANTQEPEDFENKLDPSKGKTKEQIKADLNNLKDRWGEAFTDKMGELLKALRAAHDDPSHAKRLEGLLTKEMGTLGKDVGSFSLWDLSHVNLLGKFHDHTTRGLGYESFARTVKDLHRYLGGHPDFKSPHTLHRVLGALEALVGQARSDFSPKDGEGRGGHLVLHNLGDILPKMQDLSADLEGAMENEGGEKFQSHKALKGTSEKILRNWEKKHSESEKSISDLEGKLSLATDPAEKETLQSQLQRAKASRDSFADKIEGHVLEGKDGHERIKHTLREESRSGESLPLGVKPLHEKIKQTVMDESVKKIRQHEEALSLLEHGDPESPALRGFQPLTGKPFDGPEGLDNLYEEIDARKSKIAEHKKNFESITGESYDKLTRPHASRDLLNVSKVPGARGEVKKEDPLHGGGFDAGRLNELMMLRGGMRLTKESAVSVLQDTINNFVHKLDQKLQSGPDKGLTRQMLEDRETLQNLKKELSRVRADKSVFLHNQKNIEEQYTKVLRQLSAALENVPDDGAEMQFSELFPEGKGDLSQFPQGVGDRLEEAHAAFKKIRDEKHFKLLGRKDQDPRFDIRKKQKEKLHVDKPADAWTNILKDPSKFEGLLNTNPHDNFWEDKKKELTAHRDYYANAEDDSEAASRRRQDYNRAIESIERLQNTFLGKEAPLVKGKAPAEGSRRNYQPSITDRATYEHGTPIDTEAHRDLDAKLDVVQKALNILKGKSGKDFQGDTMPGLFTLQKNHGKHLQDTHLKVSQELVDAKQRLADFNASPEEKQQKIAELTKQLNEAKAKRSAAYTALGLDTITDEIEQTKELLRKAYAARPTTDKKAARLLNKALLGDADALIKLAEIKKNAPKTPLTESQKATLSIKDLEARLQELSARHEQGLKSLAHYTQEEDSVSERLKDLTGPSDEARTKEVERLSKLVTKHNESLKGWEQEHAHIEGDYKAAVSARDKAHEDHQAVRDLLASVKKHKKRSDSLVQSLLSKEESLLGTVEESNARLAEIIQLQDDAEELRKIAGRKGKDKQEEARKAQEALDDLDLDALTVEQAEVTGTLESSRKDLEKVQEDLKKAQEHVEGLKSKPPIPAMVSSMPEDKKKEFQQYLAKIPSLGKSLDTISEDELQEHEGKLGAKKKEAEKVLRSSKNGIEHQYNKSVKKGQDLQDAVQSHSEAIQSGHPTLFSKVNELETQQKQLEKDIDAHKASEIPEDKIKALQTLNDSLVKEINDPKNTFTLGEGEGKKFHRRDLARVMEKVTNDMHTNLRWYTRKISELANREEELAGAAADADYQADEGYAEKEGAIARLEQHMVSGYTPEAKKAWAVDYARRLWSSITDVWNKHRAAFEDMHNVDKKDEELIGKEVEKLIGISHNPRMVQALSYMRELKKQMSKVMKEKGREFTAIVNGKRVTYTRQELAAKYRKISEKFWTILNTYSDAQEFSALKSTFKDEVVGKLEKEAPKGLESVQASAEDIIPEKALDSVPVVKELHKDIAEASAEEAPLLSELEVFAQFMNAFTEGLDGKEEVKVKNASILLANRIDPSILEKGPLRDLLDSYNN